MEVTSRDGIADLICINDRNSPPILNGLSNELVKEIHDFTENTNTLSRFGELRLLYKLIEKIVASNANVCRKGCSWCCRIAVDVTPVEAHYIADNTLYDINKTSRKEKNDYCPLMDKKTAECKVYAYRPFHCRTFVAYDSPDYCRDRVPHFASGGHHSGYGNQAILALARKLLSIDNNAPWNELTKSTVVLRIRDIREWFA